MTKAKPVRSPGTPWPDPDLGPWHVVTIWAVVETRIECIGFEFSAADLDYPVPIVPSWIRDVRLGEIIENDRTALNEQMARMIQRARRAAGREHEGDTPVVEATPLKVPRSGRPVQLGDDHYREVAAIYSEAHAAGQPPVVAVQRQKPASYSTASRWVTEARRRGFLAPTRRGKPRGEV